MGKRNVDQGREIEDAKKVKRTLLVIFVAYVVLMVLFYFLTGDQLKYRESRGNLEMAPAEAGSIELAEGAVVEQIFSVDVDRIQKVSVQFGAFYRENTGTLTMELVRLSDGAVLYSSPYDASQIPEGGFVELMPESPIENVTHEPLAIRLWADSPVGGGVTPLVSFAEAKEGFALSLNGESSASTLCLSVSGLDYIWTGTYYWVLVFGLGAIIAAFFMILWVRFNAGKKSYIISAFLAVKKYKFLISQLVSRDFKTRYKRSALGMLWSILNPLLMMVVQYFVFSTIFKNDIENFAVYLLIGVVMFNFFSEATGQTLNAILGNAGLITKVYMPKYIYPLTRTLVSLVNLALSLIPLVIMCLATGVHFSKAFILAIFFFVCLIIFTLGLGMLLATSMVFFRDTQFLWGVFSLMWMYATPIFYPETILPDSFRVVLKVNPLYYFVKNARICILDGISPEPMQYFVCLAIALGMLFVGSLVFLRQQNKFILYI